MQLDQLLGQKAVRQYLEHLKAQGVPPATLDRKLASIRRFQRSVLVGIPTRSDLITIHSTPGWNASTPRGVLADLYSRYTNSRVSSYLHLSILVLFAAAMAVFGYNQIFKEAPLSQAYPQAPSPKTPNRYLSFQARLTDSSDNPITTPTDVRFIVYNNETASASARLWEELRYIDPDQDGIFSVTLGTETAIASSVFTENVNLWLGVTVETDAEATPRQRIATVGYALNAETLQGFPPSASASADQIPVLTQEGDLVLAAASPMVYSSSGTFGIKGQAMSITTDTGTNGSITIQPDGTGQLLLTGSTTGTNFIRATNANLTSGHLISGYVGNGTATGDLLNLSSGAVEAEKFTVDRSGNTSIMGNLQLDGAATMSAFRLITSPAANYVLTSDASGNGTWADVSSTAGPWTLNGTNLYPDSTAYNVAIGATSATEKLTVAGNATMSGNLVFTGSASKIAGVNMQNVTLGDSATGSIVMAAGNLDLNAVSGTDVFKITNAGVKKLGIKYGTNSVTLDPLSAEPSNNLTNPTFDSDLTSWSEVPSYTLNDQFTTDRAAGAVNGTSAEPTGGTRTVVDTESKLSIASSALTFAGGKTSPAWGDPLLKYPSTSRAAGKLMVATVNSADYTKYFQVGFETTATPTQSLDMDGVYFATVNQIVTTVTPYPAIADTVNGTTYQVATVLRSTGYYTYIKGGIYTNWTLLWINSTRNTATLYPAAISYNGTYTADNIRIPTSTWLPTPLAYDTFTRADGAIGSSETTGPDSQTTPSLAWTGGAISTNKNVITPTLGSEELTNGTFDSDTGWTKEGTWAIGSGVGSASGGGGRFYQNTIVTGTWYQHQFDLVTRTSGIVYALLDSPIGSARTSPGTYLASGRATGGFAGLISAGGGDTFSGTVDNVTIKPLTLSSLFSSVSTSDTDVIADVNVTLTAGTQAGIVTNLDSTSTPANFLIAYHDGTNVKLDKNVGGTYTNLISAAATYSAGATLRVITYTSGGSLKVRVYYNNALVGSEQTVSDAGIISNTKHGLFSTYSGNSFDNFTLWARGTGAEYTGAPFEELTATRDTTTKYAGAASVKLVAAGTDANYLQSVTLPDTATYTLTAYAYTTGAAVTTADLDLYYDTGELSTTFASVGSGWYRLTGTLTGVASAKNYGVRVHAGKTVYVDSLSLAAGSGNDTTLFVANSGTGMASIDVEKDLLTAGVIRIDSNGNLLNIATTKFNGVTYTWPGADGSSGYTLTTNGSGTLSWSATAVPADVMWASANGALYPKNSTLDLLVGGQATTSAKFAVLNMNTGTPVASISAGSAGAAYLTAAGTLATTAKQSLTLGDSNTGIVSINNGGLFGVGTTAPIGKLHVTGQCVAKGTLIRRKKKKRRGDDDEEYEDIPVEDIEPGDEVLTLDETTGKFITSIVEEVMDKGWQTVLELKTASGKTIETTAEHPYLARGAAGLAESEVKQEESNNQKNGSDLSTVQNIHDIHKSSNFSISTAVNKHNILNAKYLVNDNSTNGEEKVDKTGIIITAAIHPADKLTNRPESTRNQGLVKINSIDTTLAHWTKVNNLRPGDAIATLDGWETIVSIEKIGRKHTYDLEIRNTHNFVANGIVAHNTTGKALAIFDELGNQDILTASASGTPKFTLDNSGRITLLDGVTHTIDDVSGNLTLTSNSTTISLNDNVTFAGTTTLNSLAYTWPSSQTASYVLQTNGSGTLSWVDPAGAAASGIFWASSNGALYPKNSTMDLLVGGQATTSAKFAVLNMNTGTPVASISANSGNIATYLTGDGTLATTNKQSLTIGNSSTYNTTGNVLINSNGTGNVGIGTTTPGARLQVASGGDTSTSYSARLQSSASVARAGGILFDQNSTYSWKASTINTGNATAGALVFDYITQSSGADQTANVLYLKASGNVGIVTSSPDAALEINHATGDSLRLTYNDSNGSATAYTDFSLASDGDLTIDSAGGAISLASGDDFNITAATDLIFGTTTSLGETTAANDSGAYLVGTFDEFTYSSSANVQDVLDDLDAQLLTLAGNDYWRLATGALSPINDTLDLLIGSNATTSAKFAFINVNSGTPTASISANSGNNAAYLTGTGFLGTTNKQTLTLGEAATGNVVIAPGGTTALTGIGSALTAAGNLTVNGVVTLGDNGDTVAIDSSDWNINTTGDMTNIGAITADGVLTLSNNATMSGTLTVGDGTNNLIRSPFGPLTLQYKNASEAWAAALTVQSPSGNVGIGTANPAYLLDVAGNARIQGATFTDTVYFANGTTYYVDSSGNAKFLDLQVADTGNPGLTVGNGSIGFVKIGGSTISDNAGELTLDTDGTAVAIPDGLTVTGTLTANGTLDANGLFTLGDSGDTGAIDTSDWDINTTGDMTGIGAITADGVLTLSNNATMSGTLTVGNGTTNTIKTPYGPLNLAYKSATDTWATGLTLQDTTGNVGIGNVAPGRTLDVTGNWGGNVVIDTSGAVTETRTISTKALMYDLQKSTGTTDTSTTTTWNITGLPDTDGTFAFIYSSVSKGNTANPRQESVIIQINGVTVTTVQTIVHVVADTNKEIYIASRTNGAWHLGTGTATGDGSDLAEWFPYIGTAPQAGELISINDAQPKVNLSSKSYDDNLIGIVTTKPYITMGQQEIDTVGVALSGRVPVIVTTQNGSILNGDSITSSNLPGIGMKAANAGRIAGKALESTVNWSASSCPAVDSPANIVWPEDDGTNPAKPCYQLPDGTYVGKIMVFVNLTWADPTIYLTVTDAEKTNLIQQFKNGLLEKIGFFSELIAANIKAEVISPLAGGKIFIDGDVEISGTLTAGAIESSTIDLIRDRIAALAADLNQETATPPATIDPNTLNALYQLLEPQPEATSSSLTGLTAIESQSGFFSEYLAVLGQAVITNLAVTNSVSLTHLTSPTGTIDLAGNFNVSGDLTVGGNVNILGELTAPTASFSSLLAGRITADEVRANQIIIAADATASAEIATTSASITTNATAGKAVLPAGLTEYTIYSPHVDANSLVYVSPTTDPQNQVLYVKAKQENEWFKVAINQALPFDLEFNWWIIRVE